MVRRKMREAPVLQNFKEQPYWSGIPNQFDGGSHDARRRERFGRDVEPYYLQRGCAAAIAGMAWFGLVVQLCFNIKEALIKNLSVRARMFAFFSYFTIEINLLI